MKSEIMMRRCDDWTHSEALCDATIESLSRKSSEWRGLHVEVGRSARWIVDESMFDGHFIALNLTGKTLRFETRYDSGWSSQHVPNNGLWIIPEGQPFSVRSQQDCHWAVAVVDGVFLDSLMGGHHNLRSACGIRDELLSHLFQALLKQLGETSRAEHSAESRQK